jgi:hypothetical protein
MPHLPPPQHGNCWHGNCCTYPTRLLCNMPTTKTVLQPPCLQTTWCTDRNPSPCLIPHSNARGAHLGHWCGRLFGIERAGKRWHSGSSAQQGRWVLPTCTPLPACGRLGVVGEYAVANSAHRQCSWCCTHVRIFRWACPTQPHNMPACQPA